MKYHQWDMRRPGSAQARRALEGAGLSPLCAAVLAARGMAGPEEAGRFLACGPERFHDPFLLKDMDRAVGGKSHAQQPGERQLV